MINKKRINSKQKGKRGELEWARVCKNFGFEVRRTQQFCGKNKDAADCVGLPFIHQEIKLVEKLNINKAMEQAINDSHPDLIPIVAHKKNFKDWLVTMQSSDFFELYSYLIKTKISKKEI